jgi:HAMP domain-containing protein
MTDFRPDIDQVWALIILLWFTAFVAGLFIGIWATRPRRKLLPVEQKMPEMVPAQPANDERPNLRWSEGEKQSRS